MINDTESSVVLSYKYRLLPTRAQHRALERVFCRNRKRNYRAVIWGAATGTLIAIGLSVLFGVLDVQCRNSPDGRYWNAEAQKCQPHEVGGAHVE